MTCDLKKRPTESGEQKDYLTTIFTRLKTIMVYCRLAILGLPPLKKCSLTNLTLCIKSLSDSVAVSFVYDKDLSNKLYLLNCARHFFYQVYLFDIIQSTCF